MAAAGTDILSLTREARLAPYAMSAIPAWFWAADASRLLWANASGAAALGAASPADALERRFTAEQPLGADMARLTETLPPTAQKYERLRDVGTNLVCACTRVTVAGLDGILVIASEPARASLPFAERAARLFGTSDEPLAVFTAEGALLYATGDLEPDTTLATLGADALKADALANGSASGNSALGALTLEKLGSGGATVLLATLANARDSADVRTERPAEAADPDDVRDESTPDSSVAVASPFEDTPAGDSADATIDDPDDIAPEEQAENTTTPADDIPVNDGADVVPATADLTPEPYLDDPAPAVANTPVAADTHAVRRPSLRFVWSTDADQRFTVTTPAFAEAMGSRTADALGKPWGEITQALGVDPENKVASAMASRDTWSGVVLAWPVDATNERATVELSGLPIFDRDRTFLGYRGFGVCRDAPNVPVTEATPASETASPPATEPSPEQDTEPQPEPAPEAEPRPLLTVVPAAKNVVPFRSAPPPPEKRPALTAVERSAFNEIAEALGKGDAPPISPEAPSEAAPEKELTQPPPPGTVPSAFASAAREPAPNTSAAEHAVLERLPVGVLIHRGDDLLYANRAFLEWTGYVDLAAVADAGGLERLVVDPTAGALDRTNGTGKTFTIATRTGDTLVCEGRLYSVPWNGETALMLSLIRTAAADRQRDSDTALRAAEAETRELRSILDTATDGVVVVDRDGLILTFNRSAEALFGYEYHEMARRPFTELFAPESERAARDYLDGLTKNGVASVLNDGREVIGRVRQGGLIPLFMTMGPIGVGMPKFCAVLRDITQWKRAEEDLLNAKRTAERASSAKSEFLAKISHEIRTPLNAVLGFSEVMMNEQFGALGSDRYREYMRDIHASGEHLVSLINDLLDLSKIEAGKLDLVFASVNLNSLVQQCVALMQPQANHQRIIIRSSLSQTLPPIVADARSVRQIVLNLLSNSIKFTGAGGQVIVSTALTDRAEAVLRVRDTGIGMTEKEIETAMEPFRQLATSTRYGSGGTGLGLPLTKALAEANRASFAIKSAVDAGTLVEITFPGTRVLAE